MCSSLKGFLPSVPLRPTRGSNWFRFWLRSVQFDSAVGGCTPRSFLKIWISQRNRNQIQQYFTLFIRGLDGFESWKKWRAKISWHTPFNQDIYYCITDSARLYQFVCYTISVGGHFPQMKKATTTVCLAFCINPYSMDGTLHDMHSAFSQDKVEDIELQDLKFCSRTTELLHVPDTCRRETLLPRYDLQPRPSGAGFVRHSHYTWRGKRESVYRTPLDLDLGSILETWIRIKVLKKGCNHQKHLSIASLMARKFL